MCVPALLPTSAACTSLWPVAATERRSASRCGGGCAAPRSAVPSVHQLQAAQPRHPEGERHAAMRRQCQIGARLRPRRDDRAAAGLGRRPVGLQHLAGLGGSGREAHEGWAHRRRIRTKKVARSVHASDANSTDRQTDTVLLALRAGSPKNHANLRLHAYLVATRIFCRTVYLGVNFKTE